MLPVSPPDTSCALPIVDTMDLIIVISEVNPLTSALGDPFDYFVQQTPTVWV